MSFSINDVPEYLRENVLPWLSDPPNLAEIALVKSYVREKLEKDDGEYFLNVSTLATPLLEVLSVSLHGLGTTDKPCQIHGKIYITNGRREKFFIFNTDKEKPLAVHQNDLDFLPLSGLNHVIEPVPEVKIKVDLKDGSRGDVVVAYGEFDLNYQDRDYGEHDILLTYGSDQSFAELRYVIFPYADIASVLFFFQDTDEHSHNHPIPVDVYGTIVGSYYDIGKGGVSSITLFDRSKDQSVPLSSGTRIELSRSVVTVPAYASLNIEVKLNDSRTDILIVEHTLEFGVDLHIDNIEDISCNNGFIQVSVSWESAYAQPYRGSEAKRSAEMLSNTESKSSMIEGQGKEMVQHCTDAGDEHEVEEQEKKRRLHSCDPASSTISGMPVSVEKKAPSVLPMEFGEVFSVLIDSKENKMFEVYGQISVSDCTEAIKIFDRDFNYRINCSLPCRLKSVVGPYHCFYCDEGFYMRLVLKHGDRLIAKASFDWTPDELYEDESWVDKRLCSVFRGDIGFAVVHYSIFQNAVQAEMSVLVGSKGSSNASDVKVLGQMIAFYSKQTYSTLYEKKWYRSVLFEEEDAIKCNGRLALSKAFLPVPKDSDLMVEVRLVVGVERLEDTLRIQINDTDFHEIEGNDYHIRVRVPRWQAPLVWQ